MSEVQETCPKCGRVIKANSENTLRLDMTVHAEWHELNDMIKYAFKVRLPQFHDPESVPSPDALMERTEVTEWLCEKNYKRFAALDDYIREILYTTWLPRKQEISFDKWLLNDWDSITGKFRLD